MVVNQTFKKKFSRFLHIVSDLVNLFCLLLDFFTGLLKKKQRLKNLTIAVFVQGGGLWALAFTENYCEVLSGSSLTKVSCGETNLC